MTAVMKPRMQFQRGVWYCWQPQLLAGHIGFGLTPLAAWNAYKARNWK